MPGKKIITDGANTKGSKPDLFKRRCLDAVSFCDRLCGHLITIPQSQYTIFMDPANPIFKYFCFCWEIHVIYGCTFFVALLRCFCIKAFYFKPTWVNCSSKVITLRFSLAHAIFAVQVLQDTVHQNNNPCSFGFRNMNMRISSS